MFFRGLITLGFLLFFLPTWLCAETEADRRAAERARAIINQFHAGRENASGPEAKVTALGNALHEFRGAVDKILVENPQITNLQYFVEVSLQELLGYEPLDESHVNNVEYMAHLGNTYLCIWNYVRGPESPALAPRILAKNLELIAARLPREFSTCAEAFPSHVFMPHIYH